MIKTFLILTFMTATASAQDSTYNKWLNWNRNNEVKEDAGAKLLASAKQILSCQKASLEQNGKPHIDYCLYLNGTPCGRPSITTNQVRIGRSIDCSGFISAVAAASGVKIFNNKAPACYLATTATLKNANCFQEVKPPQKLLAPGDIVNAPGNPGHVVMVSDISDLDDPYGLKKQRPGCNINPAFFNFKVIQSSRGGGPGGNRRSGRGPHETEPRHLGSKVKNVLIEKARALCQKRGYKSEGIMRARPDCSTGNPLPLQIDRCKL